MRMIDLKSEVIESGSHFFDRATMRFFNSRMTRAIEESRDRRRVYFVTSERFDSATPRKYTVRVWDRDAKRQTTIGEFQQHRTLRQARSAMYAAVHAEEGR